jgi:hypothetical protein
MHPKGCRKCLCCKDTYIPDPRNSFHQGHCTKLQCRRASKRASQRKWRAKSHYTRDNVKEATRVRAWQKANPGYGKRRKRRSVVLRDVLIAQTPEGEGDAAQDISPRPPVLREISIMQDPVFVGLIAQLTGSSYVEDIAAAANQLCARGQALLGETTKNHAD